MYIYFNPNPDASLVGDCVVRAISAVTGQEWESAYIDLALHGFAMRDMPSANRVWGDYLHRRGYAKHIIPDTCPNCYTVRGFCRDNPFGVFVLATGSHVVAVIDGDYLDSWDSGNEVPTYYWRKEK